MLEVVYFDHKRFFSRPFRAFLEETFRDDAQVNFEELDTYVNFLGSKDRLEALLPQTDVLIIHPGVDGQREVVDYPTRFPDLSVILVSPTDLGDYEARNGIRLYSYNQKESLVDYIREIAEQKASN